MFNIQYKIAILWVKIVNQFYAFWFGIFLLLDSLVISTFYFINNDAMNILHVSLFASLWLFPED
jgi:hypothetical protein